MNTIIPWLEHLNVLMHPRNIALVGAGNGKGIWAQWLLHQASESSVMLIEAEHLQYSMLQRTLDSLGERAQHCQLRNTLVGAQQGTASFFVASSQQESGLLEPRALLRLWPNLQTEEVRELGAIPLDSLLGDPSEEVAQCVGGGHWLVIDCLPAGELLRASSKLDLVDVVIARVLLGERHAVPDGTGLEEVSELLQQNGMVQIAVEATRHPDIGYALFVRDARAALHAKVQRHHRECFALSLNVEKMTKLLQESQSRIEQLAQTQAVSEQRSQDRARQLELLSKTSDEQAKLAQERQAQIEQLTEAKSAVEKKSEDRALQLEQLGKARDEQAKLVQECQAQIEQLTLANATVEKQSQELALRLDQYCRFIEDRNQEINSQLVNFIREVKDIFFEQNKKIEIDNPLINFVKKETRNITKQMEAYWRIQAVLNNQLSAPSMHGWPISADFAVLLIDTIKYESFDYIIEFGSGTSTFIICQALIKNNKINNTKFFSFEHLDKYFSATQNLLEKISIGDAPVFLIKSPLVDYSDDSGDYKFYDVSRLLLDQKSIERPKVLVIVDGPPSSTGKNTRYPALPIILEKFQGANISLILDDSDRDEEKEVVSIWRSYLNSKNLSFKEERIQLEKGALLIKVNYEDAAL